MTKHSKQEMDQLDDQPIARDYVRSFSSILHHMDRRRFLTGTTAMAALMAGGIGASKAKAAKPNPSTLGFKSLDQVHDGNFHTAEGYTHNVVIRRGDPIFADAPAYVPGKIDAKAAALQYGDSNDYVGLRALAPTAAGNQRALLMVNHEFVDVRMVVPEFETHLASPELWRMAQMAHGMSFIVVEQRGSNGPWQLAPYSDPLTRLNRRITAHTPMRISGPAAGHRRMKTSHSPDGMTALGTYGNCAGGMTPWGTVLTAEENVQFYFSGDPAQGNETESRQRFGFDGNVLFPWGQFDKRWSLDDEPNEPNHVGWIVEIDPSDPASVPVKRTALGRFKHEGAGCVINRDGRVVVYMGDDQQFEYLYRFVSNARYNKADPAQNTDLLDQGTLYAATFSDDQLVWHPLIYGVGPLTKANGFESQADVVIDARRAADLVGATPLDRPEEVEVNPVTGSVFLNLTNNVERKADDSNAVNPRGPNNGGQIVELLPPDGDHTAVTYDWTMFLMGGPLDGPEDARGHYHPQTEQGAWLASPDNITFDDQGRVIIACDDSNAHGIADGIWMADTRGPGRALPKRLTATPVGAEMCGPCLTPDGKTLFAAVQHPGMESSFDAPSTRWPDFDPAIPPRSALVAIRRPDGQKIGS